MKNRNREYRILAVKRFLKGEKPSSICATLDRSKSWLYRWIYRYLNEGDDWSESRSRCPLSRPTQIPFEIEELFQVSPDLQYEYVVATIDVKEQKMKLYLDNIQVDEFAYQLR